MRAAYELILGRVVQDVRVDVNSQLSIWNGILQLNFALATTVQHEKLIQVEVIIYH